MIAGGQYLVLVPIQALPATGVEGVLRDRAETLRARRERGQAGPEDDQALRAIEGLLDAPEAPSEVEEQPRLLLKIGEVAELLGVSYNHVAGFVQRGELPSVTLGTSRRVRRDQLLSWLDELTSAQQGGAL